MSPSDGCFITALEVMFPALLGHLVLISILHIDLLNNRISIHQNRTLKQADLKIALHLCRRSLNLKKEMAFRSGRNSVAPE
jgi:hypothetical protein